MIRCLVDLKERVISFGLDGGAESDGVALLLLESTLPEALSHCLFQQPRTFEIHIVRSGEGFKYSPPDGYRGVGEAVNAAVQERESLIEKELLLLSTLHQAEVKK